MLEKIISQQLNNEIIIREDMLKNIKIKIVESNGSIYVQSLEDYLFLKFADRLLPLIKGGNKNE